MTDPTPEPEQALVRVLGPSLTYATRLDETIEELERLGGLTALRRQLGDKVARKLVAALTSVKTTVAETLAAGHTFMLIYRV